MTAAVALSLAHQGRLALDEPLAGQLARLRQEPGRAWRPAELVDHAAAYGTPRFPPGQGFEYCDTGYVVAGILVEQATGRPLHEVYRELIFDPLGMTPPGWKVTSPRGHRTRHTTTRANSIGRRSPRRSTGPAAASLP